VGNTGTGNVSRTGSEDRIGTVRNGNMGRTGNGTVTSSVGVIGPSTEISGHLIKPVYLFRF
jgi:hypothetical protein